VYAASSKTSPDFVNHLRARVLIMGKRFFDFALAFVILLWRLFVLSCFFLSFLLLA